MEFKEINFENLESVKKKCITFARDGNTVVKPYKTLYSIEQITHNPTHKTVYVEVIPDDELEFRLWDDYGKITYSIGRVNKGCTLERFAEQIEAYGIGTEAFLKRLKHAEEEGYYINLVEIQTLVIIGETELSEHYAEYRERKIRKREEEELKGQMNQETQKKVEEEKRLEEINKQIHDTEYKIFRRDDVKNININGTSIINILMQKYGIRIPIKTQGWINLKLAKIVFGGGEISYEFYGKSQRDNSTVFRKYLVELEKKINNELALQCEE